MLRYAVMSGIFAAYGSAGLAADCAALTADYLKYDTERGRIEVSGVRDDSALRETNRLLASSLILQRQAMVLDMIIASNCDLPSAPDFSERSYICNQSRQNCVD